MTVGRVSIDPRVCHGQACVKGTRIPVHQIVRMLANGDTVDDLLAEYPSLTREDIRASLEYAADLAEEQVTPIQIAGELEAAEGGQVSDVARGHMIRIADKAFNGVIADPESGRL
jgi:uncharacterized protein (DUF433 family)